VRKFLTYLVALAAFAGCGAGASTIVIHAGHLIADPGKPVRDRQSIVIENGKITAVRDGFVAGDQVIDLSNDWVMPGLIDMHTHVSMTMDIGSQDATSDLMPGYLGRPSVRVLATIPRVQAILRNGFTTVRNLGDPSSITYDLRNAINAGIVDGPRIIASEPQFGVPGGDYDTSRFGEREDLEPLFKSRGSCAGAADCERAVREEVRRGADVIKLRLSAFTMLDPKSAPMETPEELRAIVTTAHRLNRKVAVHSIGTSAANEMAIEAGVDSIEHGPLSDKNIPAMKKRGTAFTATMLAAKLAADSPMAKEMPALGDYYKQVVVSVGMAYRKGIPILFGTDLPVVPIKRETEEFQLLQEAGLTPVDVLKSATTNAAAVLGMADSLGSIEPNKAADIIALAHNPLDDIKEMGKVVFVMKSGRVFVARQ
jgi:imidazolonepropionase-like amidohydrolase